MALSVGEVIATFDANIKGFEAGIKKAESQMQGFDKAVSSAGNKIANVFESIGKAAIGYAKILGVAGTAATVFTLKTSADLQMLSTSFETLTGSAEKGRKVFQDLVNMAKFTPFETGDLAKATQIMLGYGISVEKTQGYLSQLGDISLGNRDKLQSLSLAFGQVQGNGRLMGQELLQMINAGFNPLQIISQKTGKSMRQLRDEMANGEISFEMVAEAMKTATSEGGLFYKGMDRGAKTLAGTYSTLWDNIKLMASGLAGLSEEGTIVEGSLLDLTQKGVNALNEALTKIDWVKVGQDIRNNVVTAIEALRTAIETIINWYNQHKLAIEVLLVTLGSFVTAITIVRTAMLIYTTVMTIATAVSGGFAAVLAFITSPIGLIIIGLTALIALGYALWRNWGTLTAQGTWLGDTLRFIGNMAKSAWDAIKGFIDILSKIKMPSELQRIIDGFNAIKEVVGGKMSTIGNFLKGKIPGFANGVRNFGGGLAVVGEQGPELVNLPKGADVFTNQESRQMVGGAGITIENMNIKNGADWEYGAQFLAQRLRLS